MIPRKLWIMWYQGQQNAPFIVKECIDSWISQNREWDVVILDSNTLQEYVSLDLSDSRINRLPLAALSDLIRLELLSKYGGIWVDATTYCARPLSEWIEQYTDSGFFAFERPGKDRLLSTWFMASEKNGILVTRLYEYLLPYWQQNHFNDPNVLQKIARKVLSKILNQSVNTTKYWFSSFVTKVLRIYPYFAIHYMFEVLVSHDQESRLIWENTGKINACGPHIIQHNGLFSEPSPEVKNMIDNNQIPVYKLTWKYDHEQYTSGTLLHYLLESKKQRSEL